MDSRHWQGYFARFLLLGTIFFMMMNFADQFRYSTFLGAPGLDFLKTLSVINIVAISLLGVAAFVPAITEEKEVDSLGLLLMTGLSPLSTIVSKGGGKFLAGVALIAAQVPFTFLSVTLGGVAPIHIAAAYAVVVSYMFLVAGLALFLSVLCSRTSVAGGICLSIVLVFNILVSLNPYTMWLSPFARMSEIFATGFQGPVFSLQSAVYASSGLFFCMASWLLFDWCVRLSDGGSPIRLKMSSGKNRRFRLLGFLYPGRVWRNALAWKAFHFDSWGRGGWGATALLLCAILGITWYLSPSYSRDWDAIGEYVVVIGFIALFVEFAHVSGAVFGSETGSNTLSTLLGIPRSVWYVVYSKLLGASFLILPTLLFITIGLYIRYDSACDALTDDQFYAVAMVLVTASLFYYHLTAYLSLKIKYGAFIVAGFAIFLLYMFVGIVFAPICSSFWIFSIMFFLLHIPIVVVLHLMTGEKLKSMAGE